MRFRITKKNRWKFWTYLVRASSVCVFLLVPICSSQAQFLSTKAGTMFYPYRPETGEIRSAFGITLAKPPDEVVEEFASVQTAPLIEYLSDHAVRPEFQCRLRWKNGTLAIWDNRCTQHLAMNDYQGQRRHMHRVTLEGDRPI